MRNKYKKYIKTRAHTHTRAQCTITFWLKRWQCQPYNDDYAVDDSINDDYHCAHTHKHMYGLG